MNVWQDEPNSEQRLQELRDRDLEIARVALGLQMRTRITTLENENTILQSLRDVWSMSRISKLYFTIPIIRNRLRVLPKRLKNLIKGFQR